MESQDTRSLHSRYLNPNLPPIGRIGTLKPATLPERGGRFSSPLERRRLMTQSLSRFALSFFGALATLLISSASLSAAILYEQDFEGETLGTIGFNTTSSALGLVQVGREIAINGGTAGSSALVYSIDSSRGTQPFAMSFSKTVDTAHDADPSRLRFSVDIKVVGAVTTTPISLYLLQNRSELRSKSRHRCKQ